MAWWKPKRADVGPGSAASATHSVRVTHRTSVSDRAILLRLENSDPGRGLPSFGAGAHVDLHIERGAVRQYSLVGDPADSGAYLVCVQREDQGRGGSISVHDRLMPGALVSVSGPRNTFALRSHSSRVLLLGGGIGVTPLVSMAEQLHRDGVPFDFHVYARDRRSLPLADHLEQRPWAARVHAHYSDRGDSFRSSGPSALSEPVGGGAVYVCGPDAFVELALSRALDGGWAADQLHIERFRAPDESREGAAFEVVIASTGERVPVGENESLADALEGRGFETYRSCGQGFCGSCVVGVRGGIPDHRDDYQSDAQHRSNAIINVCVSRSRTPVLELDL